MPTIQNGIEFYEQLLTRINESLKRYDYCNKTVKYSKFLID